MPTLRSLKKYPSVSSRDASVTGLPILQGNRGHWMAFPPKPMLDYHFREAGFSQNSHKIQVAALKYHLIAFMGKGCFNQEGHTELWGRGPENNFYTSLWARESDWDAEEKCLWELAAWRTSTERYGMQGCWSESLIYLWGPKCGKDLVPQRTSEFDLVKQIQTRSRREVRSLKCRIQEVWFLGF